MAKNSFPVMPKAGGGALSKAFWGLVVVALVVLVVKYPNDAAVFVHGMFGVIGDAVGGLVEFFRGVAK
ncbi:hypothetical protein SAMN05216215_101753 [Saccharopolyspora shandongensis]|uniref:Uncharacterized protein n=1 Tax=Saccharopolyspora shandongensis TaxID=418495 RepID=A0A1H3FMN5_9PSEU|nr:hypothetical protein [Saccharopolyspora shandongensis]SDX91389.1 hypothetical protein SAMN05216215_101753 [Saccharopolyspora shandongensis]